MILLYKFLKFNSKYEETIFTFADKKRTLLIMQQKNILNFEGLYGDDYSKYSSEYIFLEFIATRSQTFNWNIKPHIHSSLYQVFIVKNGPLVFQESGYETMMEGPCIIIIPPTKIHGLVYSPNVEGQILTLSEKTVEDIFQTSCTVWKTFEEIRKINEFGADIFNEIQQILDMRLRHEYTMYVLKFKTNIKCGACVAKVTPHLTNTLVNS